MRHIVVTILLLLVAACASPARSIHMVPELQASPPRTSALPLQQGVALTEVGGGEKTNPMWTSKVGSDEFREALHLALEQARLLSSDEAAAPFELRAFIIDVKHPIAGFTMTVDAFVRYTLLRKQDGSVIFDEVLSSSYTATTEDAFVAVKRLQLAEEGAMRENISALLERLATIRKFTLRSSDQ